jgi:hypothetical protein
MSGFSDFLWEIEENFHAFDGQVFLCRHHNDQTKLSGNFLSTSLHLKLSSQLAMIKIQLKLRVILRWQHAIYAKLRKG